MKLITHIEPSQLRLGYLSCLALVAGRHLDTRAGLVDRLSRFVFRMIDASDPRWHEYMDSVDQNELSRMKIPVDQRTAELYELFRVKESKVPSHQLQALWMAQRGMSSHIGLLTKKNTERILEMGRSFEVLTTGYALSEKGILLQNLVSASLPGVYEGDPGSNPFMINIRLALKLLFLYMLLSADILTPFLIGQFANSPTGDQTNSPDLLPAASSRLVDTFQRVTDISTADLLRQCRTYALRLETKGVAKNQAQPRYHHLLELGLLERIEGGEKGHRIGPYVPTPACKIAADSLMPLRENPLEQQDIIDNNFFSWTAKIYGLPSQVCRSDLRKLYYFARGFPLLEREIGFTPGRTIAIAGCLLALEDGWIIEVSEMFDVLRRMAAGPWRSYLEYSGGSRLDQEFLIRVKPGLVNVIEKKFDTEAPNSILERGNTDGE